jgi:NTE family protein
MQHRSNAADPFQPAEKRRVALALQGGGSHGAFTWGVLDRLLAEPSLEIVGISGTSAGAMNAGVLADGLRRGGASQARMALQEYWQDVGHLRGYASLWPWVPQGTWHLDHNPVYLWADVLTRVCSPYQAGFSNSHPLRELLQRIDFEGLRDDGSAPRVFICATNVRTGLRRVFHNAELSVDVLLASACLPQAYQAVQIGHDFYWDGGYTGNPALAPLYLGTAATDLIVVGINPIERPSVPKTARGIIDRIDEISFNSTFMLELGAIAFVEQLMKSAGGQAPLRLLNVHGIGDDALGSFGASSKMNNDWSFLQHLHEIGWQAADYWLAESLSAVGNCSTVDLTGLLPQTDGSLSVPSVLKQAQLSTTNAQTRSA